MHQYQFCAKTMLPRWYGNATVVARKQACCYNSIPCTWWKVQSVRTAMMWFCFSHKFHNDKVFSCLLTCKPVCLGSCLLLAQSCVTFVMLWSSSVMKFTINCWSQGFKSVPTRLKERPAPQYRTRGHMLLSMSITVIQCCCFKGVLFSKKY